MKMKNKLAVWLLASGAFFMTASHAETGEHGAKVGDLVKDQYFNQLFEEGAELASISFLSKEDMDNTKGAFNPYGAALGAAGGAGAYAIDFFMNNNGEIDEWSWFDFLEEAGYGAAAGAGLSAARAIWLFNAEFGRGIVNGIVHNYEDRPD